MKGGMGSKVQLQPYDVELVRLLGGPFRLLTREQIETLLPGRSKGALNLRLGKLVEAGVLNVRENECGLRFYYLGWFGVKVLDPEGRDERIQRRIKETRTYSDGKLPHLQFVTWVQMKFFTAGREYKDYELVSWIPENAALWNELKKHGLSGEPDGYGEYVKSGTKFHVFAEADRGRYWGEPVRRKLEAYRRYAVSGLSMEHFSADAFRVLFITESKGRAKGLLRRLRSYPADLFWVSHNQDFFKRGLFDAYWTCHGSDVGHSLDEPVDPLPEPPEPSFNV